ncbi:MAG: endo alpha-1,4 polygalactosaminidase [Alphaproteobacteria bacterium]
MALAAGAADAASGGRVGADIFAKPWVVYYADSAPVEAFGPYGVVVLDSDSHPPLEPLNAQGKVLLGYVSLGEVEEHRSWYATVKQWGILQKENPNWKGSYYVDPRDSRWSRLVVEELVPSILAKGFAGIFIDTLDNPIYLEEVDPQQNKGMSEAAAQLVQSIRRHFPSIPIMLNRAYQLLPKVEGDIDMELGEAVYARYDFDRKAYRRVDKADYEQQVRWLKDAMARQPGLRVMTLDYWNPSDAAGIRRIYAAERANGFLPYVATLKLNRIVKEPAP